MTIESEQGLERFLDAQRAVFDQVEQELAAGRKRSHWMWFIFPQLRGLGSSATSHYYGIADLSEARSYLAHAVLGPRLIKCTSLVLAHSEQKPQTIFGGVDAMKFHSSMTLFEAAGDNPVFGDAIEAFFGSRRDGGTLALLA